MPWLTVKVFPVAALAVGIAVAGVAVGLVFPVAAVGVGIVFLVDAVAV